jgi:hypothetical protein
MMRSVLKSAVLRGATAGAAGTAALNAATYLDMATRGRPPSQTPEHTIDALIERSPVDVPGSGARREHRVSGLAGLSGIATGVGVGFLFQALRRFGVRLPLPLGAILAGGAAMAATDIPTARLHVTNPARWSARDWLSDALPHLVYGTATYATLTLLDRPED